MNVAAIITQMGFKPIRALSVWGNVFLASSPGHEHNVAIKVIKKNENSKHCVDKELRIAFLLCHDNIVKTLSVHQDCNAACIVMEHVQNDLFSYVIDHGPLSETNAKRLFLQLTLAVNYMHDTINIAHRDIDCSNILLDKKCNLKLADFSQSKKFQANFRWASTVGSRGITKFSAPEVLTEVSYDLVKADVFSMGIALYFMLSGEFPSRTSNEEIDLFRMSESSCSRYCVDLLTHLLSSHPLWRYSTKKILMHGWFNQTPALTSRKTQMKSLFDTLLLELPD